MHGLISAGGSGCCFAGWRMPTLKFCGQIRRWWPVLRQVMATPSHIAGTQRAGRVGLSPLPGIFLCDSVDA